MLESIEEAAGSRRIPLVVVSAGGEYTEVLKRALEEKNVPTFSSTQRAVGALAALWTYSKKRVPRSP